MYVEMANNCFQKIFSSQFIVFNVLSRVCVYGIDTVCIWYIYIHTAT